METIQTPEFTALWQAFLDDALDAGQAAELDRLLRAAPALAALAGERYVEHRLLALALRREEPGRFAAATLARVGAEGRDFSRRIQERISPAPSRLPIWRRHAVAAALLIAIAGIAWLAASRPAPSALVPAPLPQAPVATLVLSDACVWEGAAPKSGQRLQGALHLRSGTALLRFDSGAEALLSGVADLELQSAASAALARGQVTIRAAAQAAGFVLRTPFAEFTDLGTEFALGVDRAGVTDLDVLEGTVAWKGARSDPDAAGNVLRAGQAVRVRSASDATGETRPSSALSLAAQLRELAAPDQGRLLSYDGFDYPFARTVSRRREAAGGFGWRSPWYRNQPGNELPLDFLPGRSLAMPAELLPAAGGALSLVTEVSKPDTYRDAYMRLFVEPLDLAREDERYVSLLVQRSPTWDGPTHHWFRCMLTSEKVSTDRLGFEIRSDGCPRLLSRFGDTNGTEPIQDGQPYLCVLKVASDRVGPDQAFLKLYGPGEPIDRHEPSQWTLIGRPGHYDGVLGSIHINNGTERAWIVDELRIGTSWEAVTPRRPQP